MRDLRGLRDRELAALEAAHKAARDDMIKLCNEGVASLADHCLDVAVGGGRVRVESPEMEDAVWQAFQREINGKLHEWTLRYCTGDQRARLAAPPLAARKGGKGVDKSLPSTPSTAGAGGGPATPPTVSEGAPSDGHYDSH